MSENNITMYAVLQVKYNYFYKQFTEKFNIGFGNPATDTCSTCETLSFKIQEAGKNKDAEKKKALRTELKIHRAKAKGYYRHMKTETDDSVSFVFDLQQV